MFRIAGTGHALPRHRVTTGELAARHGHDARRLCASPGVIERPVATDEDQANLGARAARVALERAGLAIGDIDLLISACGVSYQPIPGLAPLLMRALGAPDGSLGTLDVNTTCLSFVSALDLAETLIAAGRHERILVVSSEIASRGLPWHDDPETAALFGDGAGAAVVARGPGRIAARGFEAHPSAWEACQLASGGTRLDRRADPEAFEKGGFFRMNGKELYRVTAARFPAFVRALLERAGWAMGEVDLLVPHQASPLALRHMARALGLEPSRVVDITRDHGNMVAASIPLALSLSFEAGRIRPGDRVLLLGTSAGVAFGGLAIEVGA